MGYLLALCEQFRVTRKLNRLQARSMSIGRQIEKMTKNIANVESMFSKQIKNIKQNLQFQKNQALAALKGSIFGDAGLSSNYSAENMQKYNQYQMQQQDIVSQFSYLEEIQITQLEEERDRQKEDIQEQESDLQAEQDTIKTQIDYLKEYKNTLQSQVQEGAKDAAPKFGV